MWHYRFLNLLKKGDSIGEVFLTLKMRSLHFLSLNIVHYEDLGETLKALSEAANGLEELFMENRYQCQNVSYKWIEWKVKSILEEYRFNTVGCDINHLCTSCKKIRDDMGYWNHIEAYISEHSQVEFTHCICPECATKFIWNLYNK